MAIPAQITGRSEAWYTTPDGKARGYIEPQTLKELWFHTGTNCNLSCPFCLEGSKPGDTRLGLVKFEDVKPFIDEAMELGVEQFSFTGGEPFVAKDMVKILRYAADRLPCLVLTNATEPVHKRIDQIATLLDAKHPVSFRVSIDYADEARHDEGRGAGNYRAALEGMKTLHDLGFHVSVARQMENGEDTPAAEDEYHGMLAEYDIPSDARIVSFPDFHRPGAHVDTPHVTENCMTTYQTAETRAKFMCAFSRMVVKGDRGMRVYACTLVDDDPEYDLGTTLRESMEPRVSMKHHRCFSCFSYGASCSEL
ncbi:MAG: radical SAM protein [Gemmatimonadetes bacterium]|nr:radical SAM protein [Gemmatimonadota bacterium]